MHRHLPDIRLGKQANRQGKKRYLEGIGQYAMSTRHWRLFLLLYAIGWCGQALADTKADRHWRQTTKPIFGKHCSSCHNEADQKGGINLDAFDFVVSVVRRGELMRRVVEQIEMGQMPPPNKPRMTATEKETLISLINNILDSALSDPDPGPSIMRRLSHREYSYTIKDLTGLDFDAMAYLPTEGSGGEGFDNQSGVLYVTPLTLERYYNAADSLVRAARAQQEVWRELAPKSYRPSWIRRMLIWADQLWGDDPVRWPGPSHRASEIVLPFAAKAYRRLLSPEEKSELVTFFDDIYFDDVWRQPDGFELALATTFKRILVAPAFLYRMEVNLPIHEPYQISNFELATRLSYLLWSSMPDDTLAETAYREDLSDPAVLNREALRMMRNPKFRRFAESFAPQWLGVEESLREPKADQTLYPELTKELASAMHEEVVSYFFDVLTNRGNLLELLSSDYTMLNEPLAEHYGIKGVEGPEFRRVAVADHGRGGVLGMGAVLTATSLPTRTSPVLRGQWVVEQIMGGRVPPPPPDVPELEAAKGEVHDELDLRALLEKHRAPSSCTGCHQKMDPIGLAMENFDAIGRWRNYYRGEVAIDVSTQLEDGSPVNGPLELRDMLAEEKTKFARSLSRKLLSYALGRSTLFTDSPTLKTLTDNLLEHNFNGEEMMMTLINSYAFQHRRSDMTDLYIKS